MRMRPIVIVRMIVMVMMLVMLMRMAVIPPAMRGRIVLIVRRLLIVRSRLLLLLLVWDKPTGESRGIVASVAHQLACIRVVRLLPTPLILLVIVTAPLRIIEEGVAPLGGRIVGARRLESLGRRLLLCGSLDRFLVGRRSEHLIVGRFAVNFVFLSIVEVFEDCFLQLRRARIDAFELQQSILVATHLLCRRELRLDEQRPAVHIVAVLARAVVLVLQRHRYVAHHRMRFCRRMSLHLCIQFLRMLLQVFGELRVQSSLQHVVQPVEQRVGEMQVAGSENVQIQQTAHVAEQLRTERPAVTRMRVELMVPLLVDGFAVHDPEAERLVGARDFALPRTEEMRSFKQLHYAETIQRRNRLGEPIRLLEANVGVQPADPLHIRRQTSHGDVDEILLHPVDGVGSELNVMRVVGRGALKRLLAQRWKDALNGHQRRAALRHVSRKRMI